MTHYRARSAFKLLELDKKYNNVKRAEEPNLQRSNDDVLQDIISERESSTSTWCTALSPSSVDHQDNTIIALDLLPIAPIRGVRIVRQDFLAGGEEAELVGNRTCDEAVGLEICEVVYQFAARHLQVGGNTASDGGTLVLKHFANESMKTFYLNLLKPNFYHTYIAKPEASRGESSEYYFVSKGFKGDPYYKTNDGFEVE